MSKNNYKDILFKIYIFLFISIFTVFITLTIFVVFQKSFPNLASIIMDKEIQFAIKLTLYTSTISTIICLIFAVPIAYGLARYDFFGKMIINSIIQISNSIPPIAAGIALLMLFSTKQVEDIINKLGLDPVFSVKGIILANFFINVPYMIRILKGTFEDVNPRLEFVGRTLGCSVWGVFFKITIPLAKNGLISAIIITWINALGEFGTALMLAGAIRMKTETLPVAIFLNLSVGNLDKALAAATILIIISIICLFAFECVQKCSTKKVNY
ncbi:ABC transporter permease [Clostridium sp. 001]|uniref:ABC transporter permease n=1 Tax=Clostridium sp. 001 TaxID=1970093 RepID=UPI001C2BA97E|nr:ABC transporter permease subunit [Clostridium sp. 001]QXE18833.1 molybdenum ABC transporter permease [Clostridium sp. 001]